MTSLILGWISRCLSILRRTPYLCRSSRRRVAPGPEITAERVDRLLGGGVGVGDRERLGGGEPGIADLAEGLGDRREVHVAEAGRPPVRVDEMDVPDVLAGRPERVGRVDLLDVH